MNLSNPTRDHILLSAAQLIRSLHRPEEFTVRRLTAHAGVNLNAINYYFGSKAGLIREAVRRIIGDYYQRNDIKPADRRSSLFETVVVVTDFLFSEPTAAKLALASEQESQGDGQSLTSETLNTLLNLGKQEYPGLEPSILELRLWTIVSSVHQMLWRPRVCATRLGCDPLLKRERDQLLEKLFEQVGFPNPKGGSIEP